MGLRRIDMGHWTLALAIVPVLVAASCEDQTSQRGTQATDSQTTHGAPAATSTTTKVALLLQEVSELPRAVTVRPAHSRRSIILTPS